MIKEWHLPTLAAELAEEYPDAMDIQIEEEIDPRVVLVTMRFEERTKRYWFQWFGPFGWLRL